MLKKFPWKTVLLTIIAWTLFWEVKGEISGERMSLLVRWLYSDIGHVKEIEVLPYILTDEQVQDLILHPDHPIQQPSKNELSSKNMYIVLRIRDLAGGRAWGRLSWKLPYGEWSVVDVPYIPGPRKAKKFSDIIIPTGTLAMERENSLPEPITVKWDELYVYR